MSHLHLKSGLRSGFKLSTLALSISLSLISPALFALEALDDDGLAESTGEGVAFLPENFSMLMQGANDTNPIQADLNDRTQDTGYIRLIPVGPLTTQAAASGAGKADVFLYGMAISQSNKNYGAARDDADWNGRFGRNINSWGSGINPWLFKVATEQNVPNFSALTPGDTGKGDVSYLMLEAPLYDKNINALTEVQKSAYNLKLGMWSDIFVRDPTVAESLTSTGTQFNLGGANRANRLRLQAVWDGLSLNGSNIKLFQTLGGANGNVGISKNYNNTLGITGLLRFNGGDGKNLRATVVNGSADRVTTTNMRYTPTFIGRPGTVAVSNTNAQNRNFRLRSVDTVDTVVAGQWSLPTISSVLRLSTRETPNTLSNLLTPAINKGSAPTFDANEGLFLYNPNINLVLGSLFQPLTVGVGDDGKNLVLELARIPNKESIYKQIYTNYANGDPTSNGGYYGSTCNINACGSDDTTTYQGKNATHSSIAIGSTQYDSTLNLTTAYKGKEALGVSFGSLQNTSAGTASTNRYYELQQQERRRGTDQRWQYLSGETGTSWANGTNNCNINNGQCYQFDLAGWRDVSSYNKPDVVDSYNPTISHGDVNVTGQSNPVVPAWGPLNDAVFSGTTWTTTAPPPSAPTAQQAMPFNNLGSAVIDGILIQHMKITTKGL